MTGHIAFGIVGLAIGLVLGLLITLGLTEACSCGDDDK